MGIETAALIIGAVAAVGATTAGVVAGNQQRAAARHANDLQTQAQNEQRAGQYAQAAEERRAQVRQARIKAATIAQSSANSGTEGGSGELGATSSVATQLNTNLGYNAGAFERGQQIGNLRQDAANSIFEGQQAASTANVVGSLFGAVGQVSGSYTSTMAKNKKGPTSSIYDSSFDNPSDYG